MYPLGSAVERYKTDAPFTQTVCSRWIPVFGKSPELFMNRCAICGLSARMGIRRLRVLRRTSPSGSGSTFWPVGSLIFRMLYGQGILIEDLEVVCEKPTDLRKIWQIFANHYYLVRGTPPASGSTLPFRRCSHWSSRCQAVRILLLSVRPPVGKYRSPREKGDPVGQLPFHSWTGLKSK